MQQKDIKYYRNKWRKEAGYSDEEIEQEDMWKALQNVPSSQDYPDFVKRLLDRHRAD